MIDGESQASVLLWAELTVYMGLLDGCRVGCAVGTAELSLINFLRGGTLSAFCRLESPLDFSEFEGPSTNFAPNMFRSMRPGNRP